MQFSNISVSFLFKEPTLKVKLPHLSENIQTFIINNPNTFLISPYEYEEALIDFKNDNLFLKHLFKKSKNGDNTTLIFNTRTPDYMYLVFLPSDYAKLTQIFKKDYNMKIFEHIVILSVINEFDDAKKEKIEKEIKRYKIQNLKYATTMFNVFQAFLLTKRIDFKSALNFLDRKSVGALIFLASRESVGYKPEVNTCTVFNCIFCDENRRTKIKIEEVIEKQIFKSEFINFKAKDTCHIFYLFLLNSHSLINNKKQPVKTKTKKEFKLFDREIKIPRSFSKKEQKNLKFIEKGIKLNGKFLIDDRFKDLENRVYTIISILYNYKEEWPLLIVCPVKEKIEWVKTIEMFFYEKFSSKIFKNPEKISADFIKESQKEFQKKLYDLEYIEEESGSSPDVYNNQKQGKIEKKPVDLEKTSELLKKEFDAFLENKEIVEIEKNVKKFLSMINFITKGKYLNNLELYKKYRCVVYSEKLGEKTAKKISEKTGNYLRRLVVSVCFEYTNEIFSAIHLLSNVKTNNTVSVVESPKTNKSVEISLFEEPETPENVEFLSSFSLNSPNFFLRALQVINLANFNYRYVLFPKFTNSALRDDPKIKNCEDLFYLLDKISVLDDTLSFYSNERILMDNYQNGLDHAAHIISLSLSLNTRIPELSRNNNIEIFTEEETDSTFSSLEISTMEL